MARVRRSCLLALVLCLISASPSFAKTKPKPTIALVNHVHFHLEVIAGFLEIFREYESQLTVFLHPKLLQQNFMGFLEWVGPPVGTFVDYRDVGDKKFDIAIFISPEWSLPYIQKFVNITKPKTVIAMIHNGNSANLQEIASLVPNTQLITLSPHVAKNVSGSVSNLVDWVLPVLPFIAPKPCSEADLSANSGCVRGFCVQGRVESTRRNYTQMWSQMASHSSAAKSTATGGLGDFHMIVLGQRVTNKWSVPAEVSDMVSVNTNLPYPQFYDIIHHSVALVPMLASEAYYTAKFSSTLLSSVVTGTPAICDKRILEAYTMFDENTVIYQKDGEEEMDTMFRVLTMPPSEIWKRRKAIEGLRQKLNDDASKKLKQMMGFTS